MFLVQNTYKLHTLNQIVLCSAEWAAFHCFNNYTRTIVNFHKEDHKDKWKMYRLAKMILRKKHNVTAKSYTGKRKRKSSTAAAPRKFYTMVVEFRNQITFLQQY